MHAVLAFMDLDKLIFTIPEVTVRVYEQQDLPLENFFGQRGQRGRINENPNVQEFIKSMHAGFEGSHDLRKALLRLTIHSPKKKN